MHVGIAWDDYKNIYGRQTEAKSLNLSPILITSETNSYISFPYLKSLTNYYISVDKSIIALMHLWGSIWGFLH